MRLLVVLAALTICASAARADSPAPLRHLVYSFTYESRQNGAVTNDPGSSGAQSYSGRLDDTGTITIDVLREAPDRGLVVTVSERGESSRRATPTTCAVYGNTGVACDPSKTVNSEEYAILRFLGVNFFDPNAVDVKQHWSISQKNGPLTVSADYVITQNNGGVMTIAESRHVEDASQGVVTSDARTKLSYDANRLLPTAVDEYVTEQRHSGVLGTSTTIYQTTLALASDSMAK